jgi:16S rRNA processing protein RimM
MRIELMLDDDRLFEAGRQVQLKAASGKGESRNATIEFFRRQHGRCILKLREIDAISAVEPWIGAEVRIGASDLGQLQAGWFYTFQLKGCRVFTTDGAEIGIVSDVLDIGGGEILKVDRGSEETLIPFAQSYMKKIDVEQRRIEVDLPEGLRELNK